MLVWICIRIIANDKVACVLQLNKGERWRHFLRPILPHLPRRFDLRLLFNLNLGDLVSRNLMKLILVIATRRLLFRAIGTINVPPYHRILIIIPVHA